MSATLEINPNGSATFKNFTPLLINAEDRGTGEAIRASLQAKIDSLQLQLNALQTTLNSKYSSITQTSNGNIGIASTEPRTALEVRGTGITCEATFKLINNPFILQGSNNYLQAQTFYNDQTTESTCYIDLTCYNTNASVNAFRFFANANVANPLKIQIFKGNNTSTVNCEFSGNTNSFLNADNGNVGVGTKTPAYKLDVVGSSRFNGNIGFFNKTPIGQQTGGAKTAAAMYSTNEQTMLQTVYNCLRNFGFLS